jgi:hypothetical protein
MRVEIIEISLKGIRDNKPGIVDHLNIDGQNISSIIHTVNM